MTYVEEVAESRARLVKNLDCTFYKGPDINMAEEVTLMPSGSQDWQIVPVTVTKYHLPPLEGLYREDLSLLQGSLKSRRAQTGIDLCENPGDLVSQYIRRHCYSGVYADNPIAFHQGMALEFPGLKELCYKTGYRDLEDIFQEPLTLSMLIANRSTRPIILEKGMGLFRFYCPLTPSCTGKQLESLIGSEIKVEGREGEDWAISYNKQKTATGLFVHIKPVSESWMPPSKEPILVKDTDRQYRKTIDLQHQPLPQQTPCNFNEILCIGETPRVTLSNRVNALIYKAVSPTIDGSHWLERCPGVHNLSWLIDGGSDWGIRTETMVIYPRKSQEQYIYFSFFLEESVGSSVL